MTSAIRHPAAEKVHGDRLRSALARPLQGVAAWALQHRLTLYWLTPVLAIAGVVQAVNMGGSPQRIDDEGTYTAQAWAVDYLGQLAHYTFWYDHPPLGWLQMAGYARLTDAFGRYDVAVIAMREAMLVAAIISAFLVWVLARRLRLSRAAAAVATFVFAVSPLAVQFHRSVYLDNVATPWLLGAFVLATGRRHQLAGFAGSAACFGIAVLSKETYLLALPFLIWMVWRNAHPSTRRYTLAVAMSVLVLIGGSYLLLAAVKGEFFPSAGRVSLIDGVTFQLGSRQSSGSVFDPNSLINKVFTMWWRLDPVLIVTGTAAAVAGLFLRRLRPIAAMVVFLVLFMFRPGGYLPVPYVIALLPFAAILIAGVGDTLAHWLGKRRLGKRRPAKRVAAIAGCVAAAVALGYAVPLWFVQLRGLELADLDQPGRQAEQWISDNVPRSSRLIVDDSMWVDLVNEGFAQKNVVWYYKVDTDPAVQAQSPNGWRDSNFIVTTDSMRTFPSGFPQVKKAIDNSMVVARFGTGKQAVDIRRIYPQGSAKATTELKQLTSNRAHTGTQLAANPNLEANTVERHNLDSGLVDSRISLLLGQLAASGKVTVGGFPEVQGESGLVRRQVLITNIGGRSLTGDGQAARQTRSSLSVLGGSLGLSDISLTGNGVLVTFSAEEAADLNH